MTIDELEKNLKAGVLESIYLLYGEEEFLLENSVKRIKKLFGELLNGINYIQLDDKSVAGLISDIETPAFGYEKKIIIVKNSGLFKKELKGRKKDESKSKKNIASNTLQEKVAKFIEENIDIIKKSVILVFIEQEIGTNDLQKVIEKYGVVCNFEGLKPIQIAKRIKTLCNMYKVNIDEKTINYFIETCGTKMLNLINEIRKLIEYVGENGTITVKDIDTLSIRELDSVIFDLTDSIGKKNSEESIRILKELLYNKEPIQKILITLYNHLKKIYLIKLAEVYNENATEVLSLKPNQMFLITKYKKQASYFKQEELRKMLQNLIDLDYKSKQGLIDVNIGLESILCMM